MGAAGREGNMSAGRPPGGRLPFSRGHVVSAAKKNPFGDKTFPKEFDKKVNMKKVNVQKMREWSLARVTEIQGEEDEIVNEYVSDMLDAKKMASGVTLDPKGMSVELQGFMGSNA